MPVIHRVYKETGIACWSLSCVWGPSQPNISMFAWNNQPVTGPSAGASSLFGSCFLFLLIFQSTTWPDKCKTVLKMFPSCSIPTRCVVEPTLLALSIKVPLWYPVTCGSNLWVSTIFAQKLHGWPISSCLSLVSWWILAKQRTLAWYICWL